MDEKIQVYVPLLKEGTTVWRPVIANPVSDSFFLLVGPVPDGEQWKFQPGELVRCEYRVFASGDRALAAEERADTTPRNSIH